MVGGEGGAGLPLTPDPRVRAGLYFALSECYKEPCDSFAEDVASGALQRTLLTGLATVGSSLDPEALRLPGATAEVLAQLRKAYYPLFVIPPHFVLPVESVFKEWSGEGAFLSGRRGLIMGPPAEDMLRRYRERGLAVTEGLKDYPDHLALLLEYGGLVCAAGEEETLAGFVASHLDGWVEEFAAEVCRLSRSEFYRSVARATVAFVQAERDRLGIMTEEVVGRNA